MSALEFAARLASAMKPLMFTSLAVVGITMLAAGLLYLLSRNTWIDKPGFSWYGLFFNLTGWQRIRLAAGWLQFIFYICFLIPLQEISTVHYVLLLILALVAAPDFKDKLKNIVLRLFLTLLLIGGLFCAVTVWDYIANVRSTPILIWAYVAMAVFLGLFDLYIFITGLESVSAGRSEVIEKE